MATVSIPEKLYKKLRRVSEDQGMSVEGYVLSLVAESVDPGSGTELYWDASEGLLKQAGEELSEGDLRQASEKIWGAAALAVKAIAYKREGVRLSSHGALWEYVGKLVNETGDRDLGRLWRSVSSMHVNFYEGWATREHVEDALRDVENLMGKLKRL